MSDRTFELSRRKALIGLGTVGAASAGAGMGTSAFFSDQEEFTGNTIQAGEFSMAASLVAGQANQDGIGPDEEDWYSEITDDGEAVVGHSLDIEDLKPGDTYEFCWCVTVRDNPGVVRYVVSDWESKTGYEAGNVSADDIYDIDDDDDFIGIDDREHDPVSATQQLFVCDPSHAEEVAEPEETEDYNKGQYLKEPNDYDSFGDWLNSAHDTGTPVGIHDGAAHWNEEKREIDYVVIGADDDNNVLDNADQAAVLLCVTLDVDEDVGNELQGAELSFNFEFHAEQHRHNDDPFDVTPTEHVDMVDWSNPPITNPW